MDEFTHFTLGLIAYVIFTHITNIHLAITYFLVGCIIIDVDHIIGFLYKQIRKKWKIDEKRLKGIQKIIFFPRTIFHSLYGAFFFSIIFFLINKQFLNAVSLFAGIIVHLSIDSMDKLGIRWLPPFVHIRGRMPVSYHPEQETIGFNKFQKRVLTMNIVIVCIFLIYVIIK